MRSMTPGERGQLTLDAIDAVEMVDADTMQPAEVIELGDDAVLGLVLYVNLLETMLYLTRGQDIPVIRDVARANARSLLTEATT